MKNITVLFGGASSEHTVSIRSAWNVISSLDQIEKYKVLPVFISQEGGWFLINDRQVIESAAADFISITEFTEEKVLLTIDGTKKLISDNQELSIDVVLPVTHGENGEDGALQGLLQLSGIPFVGPKVAGSVIAMDKDVAKRLLGLAGIKVSAGEVVLNGDEIPSYSSLSKTLGESLFVKPARSGSSVGVTRATDQESLKTALEEAFKYDSKVLIEEEIKGREIECSVLGRFGDMIASEIGEISPPEEGYTFDEKYLESSDTGLAIPAKLPEGVKAIVQAEAVKACRALGCEEISRVDFFLKANGELILNEINTLPGFTSISMYPKLLEASGISTPELMERLVENAQPGR